MKSTNLGSIFCPLKRARARKDYSKVFTQYVLLFQKQTADYYHLNGYAVFEIIVCSIL